MLLRINNKSKQFGINVRALNLVAGLFDPAPPEPALRLPILCRSAEKLSPLLQFDNISFGIGHVNQCDGAGVANLNGY